MSKLYEREIAELEENTSASIVLKKIRQGARVLECGCGTGGMTRFMRDKLNASVSVVEFDEANYQLASQYAADGICANLELIDKWLPHYEGKTFDYVMLMDVLEHLRNPEQVLNAAVGLLKSDGEVIVSIPNVAHADILLSLYNGEWNYTEYGLLDNTHIHFWGNRNFVAFLQNAGLTLKELDYVIRSPLCTEQARGLSNEAETAFFCSVCEKDRTDIYQMIAYAKKHEDDSKNDTPYLDRYEERHQSYGGIPGVCELYRTQNQSAVERLNAEGDKLRKQVDEFMLADARQKAAIEQLNIEGDKLRKQVDELMLADARQKAAIEQLNIEGDKLRLNVDQLLEQERQYNAIIDSLRESEQEIREKYELLSTMYENLREEKKKMENTWVWKVFKSIK